MEQFIEGLKANQSRVLSLEYVSPEEAVLRFIPPKPSSAGPKDAGAVPFFLISTLEFRLGTTVEYEDPGDGSYALHVTRPGKPFSESGLRELASRHQLQFLVRKNGHNSPVN
ncbi:MAG: hypothetical protein V1787_05680 [Candidatus Micrarchaeota archaeon]